jgi:tRNA A58 N-methylase Trm61
MDWRMKCLAFHLLRFAPRAAYTFLQRNVTNRYFTALTPDVIKVYAYHVQNFPGGRALEFGAGTSLVSALLLSAAGAEEVLAYDIKRIATVEQVNHAIRQLRAHHGDDWPEIDNLGDSLQRLYRIRYCAPADARDTRLPPQSVDFICSTSTLEHIAPKDIRAILMECRRIASPFRIGCVTVTT